MRQRGFTLIEMLVVMMLIGMSAAIVLPSMAYTIRRKQQIQTVEQITHIATALSAYWDLHAHKLPTELKDMQGNTILGIPTDGWNQPFEYNRIDDDHYELWSRGSDNLNESHSAGPTQCWQSDVVYKNGIFFSYPQGTQKDCQ